MAAHRSPVDESYIALARSTSMPLYNIVRPSSFEGASAIRGGVSPPPLRGFLEFESPLFLVVGGSCRGTLAASRDLRSAVRKEAFSRRRLSSDFRKSHRDRMESRTQWWQGAVRRRSSKSSMRMEFPNHFEIPALFMNSMHAAFD